MISILYEFVFLVDAYLNRFKNPNCFSCFQVLIDELGVYFHLDFVDAVGIVLETIYSLYVYTKGLQRLLTYSVLSSVKEKKNNRTGKLVFIYQIFKSKILVLLCKISNDINANESLLVAKPNVVL